MFCSTLFMKCLELLGVQACFFDEIHTLNHQFSSNRSGSEHVPQVPPGEQYNGNELNLNSQSSAFLAEPQELTLFLSWVGHHLLSCGLRPFQITFINSIADYFKKVTNPCSLLWTNQNEKFFWNLEIICYSTEKKKKFHGGANVHGLIQSQWYRNKFLYIDLKLIMKINFYSACYFHSC